MAMQLVDPRGNPVQANMPTNTYSGGFGRELLNWSPSAESADRALLPNLNAINNRAYDITRNEGYASGAIQIHIDNIVGHQFKLILKPRHKLLGIDRDEAMEWARMVELKFANYAESPDCFFDAEMKRTFTMMVREVVGVHATVGEHFAAAEWDKRRPYATCIKMVDPQRISNPNGLMDSSDLRAGIELGRFGEATHYHLRTAHQADQRFGVNTYQWKRISKFTKTGRLKMLHTFEPTRADQTRGDAGFASVLGNMKMLQKFSNTTLQNAIVNAMYAAVIETDVNTEQALDIIGGNEEMLAMMDAKADWAERLNLKFDGVKIPHLFPGERFDLKTAASPGADYSAFESSMLRKIASGLNVSYEQLARDYTKTNYSGARAGLNESWRFFMGRRAVIAKRWATQVFKLWLEEAIDRGDIPMPAGAPSFHEASNAWANCDWIGAGRPSVDGLKEVKEMIAKLEAGLITYEKACAELGEDYQEIFDQQVREMQERKAAGLPPPRYVPDGMISDQSND